LTRSSRNHEAKNVQSRLKKECGSGEEEWGEPTARVRGKKTDGGF